VSKELLFSVTRKDFTIQTFTSGGPGGQHQNRVETGVRIVHKDSGAVGESREGKSQHANKKAAFKRLAESDKFQKWIKLKASELSLGKTVDQQVDEWMDPSNMVFEVKDEKGKWIKENV
jgi:protein subunit release factor B